MPAAVEATERSCRPSHSLPPSSEMPVPPAPVRGRRNRGRSALRRAINVNNRAPCRRQEAEGSRPDDATISAIG
eukprot:CAMPEP_0113559740 /NCGR_PEP_ID=MMETSP0015_2-20120614/19059_1 /TAXON_ID=2838 /ORGANISM="Odontella" /LENGTH=73 /DNA_ID=CAMNT_0000461399 /DNA_START=741 /DNA_END=958 /DNA_ORIENTATION=- /assembly_acc=CAM_ASM_000160